jgi:hypothetical protein
VYVKEQLAVDLAEAAKYPELVGDRRILRFLRGHKYDLGTATTMMRNMLKWRKENNVDSIRDSIHESGLTPERFPHYDAIHPYYPFLFSMEHFDKFGNFDAASTRARARTCAHT